MATSTARRIAGLLLAGIVTLAAGCGGGGGGGDDNSTSIPDNSENPGNPNTDNPGDTPRAATWDSSKWDDTNVVWAE